MISDVIRTALAKGKKKQTDIAAVYQCDPSVIYSKMRRSSWSAADLARVAGIVGAQLVFAFPDGELLRIVEDRPIPKKVAQANKEDKAAKEDNAVNPALPKKTRNTRKKKTNNKQYKQMTFFDET